MSGFRHLTKEEQIRWYINFLEEKKRQIEEELKYAEKELKKVKK